MNITVVAYRSRKQPCQQFVECENADHAVDFMVMTRFKDIIADRGEFTKFTVLIDGATAAEGYPQLQGGEKIVHQYIVNQYKQENTKLWGSHV